MKKASAFVLLSFFLPLPVAAQGNILEFHPASEVVPMLEAARSQGAQGKSAPALTLIHFSDLHGDAENLARIARFKDAYKDWIEDAIHVGDVVACYWDDPNPWDEVPSARNIMNVVGNHDCWKGHLVWAQSSHPYDATAAEAYELIMVGRDKKHPFIADWGVESPSDGLCYYYKDYSEQGVRLIALDCMHYDEAQQGWFIGLLEDAREKGLTVLGVQHYPAQSGLDKIPSGFSDKDVEIGPEPSPAPGGQFERFTDEAFAAVDAFLDAGGSFACWLSGHMHLDFIGHIPGHERQLQIIADKAGAKDDYMQEARPRGTRFQDSFNLVTVNTGRSLLVVKRIGCDRDQYLRSKSLFCYDYISGNVLVNE